MVTRKPTIEAIPEFTPLASHGNTPPRVEAIPEDTRTAENKPPTRTNTTTRKPTVEAIPELDNNERSRRTHAPPVEQIPEIVAETRRPPSRRTEEDKLPDIIASTRPGTRSNSAPERTPQNSGTGIAPTSGWNGTFVGEKGRATLTCSATGGSLSCSGQYNLAGAYHKNARGSGQYSNCRLEGNKATCDWTGSHEDDDKTATATGTATMTLSGDKITGTNVVVVGSVTWKGGHPLYASNFEKGNTSGIYAERQK